MTTPKVLTIAEIDVPRCSLTWGVAPCTASGALKCFNTPATCQDPDNYAEDSLTLRFAGNASYLPRALNCNPVLLSAEISPSIVSLGRSLGHRETVRLTFRDRPHSDTGGIDPYLADRDYDPFQRGTYWGKFRARSPYVRSRAMRLRQGFLESIADLVADGDVAGALAALETRHYVGDSFDGPTPDGKFVLIGKDPLKSLDDDRALAPKPSNGFLLADITSSATAATLSPSGIGNTEYPASGYVAIGGKEICSFTRSGDALTLSRAKFNTTAVSHKAQDRVQLCVYFLAQKPGDIIATLSTDYAEIDPTFLPTADWESETDSFLDRVYTALIPEPTGVRTLINELIVQAALQIWWDPIGQKVRLRVLRAIDSSAEVFDESKYARRSLTVREQPELRVSRVVTYFAQVNPLKKLDDLDNYRSTHFTIDIDAEALYGSPAVFKILSRWVPEGGRAIVQTMNAKHLSRYINPPRQFSFDLLRRDGVTPPALGAGYELAGWLFQDATGAPVEVPFSVTSIKPEAPRYAVEGEELRFAEVDGATSTSRDIIIDSNSTNKNIRTLNDALYGAPIVGGVVRLIVQAGVILGSTSTSTPALDAGTWPTAAVTGNRTSGSPVISALASTSGWVPGMAFVGTAIPSHARILTVDSPTQVTLDKNATASATGAAFTVHLTRLTVVVYGRVQGTGGKGGRSGGTSENGQPGLIGGPALYARYPFDLEVAAGEIWGGGGGGGGGGVAQGDSGDSYAGGGGGGGQGFNPGLGGVSGQATIANGSPGSPGTSETYGAYGLGAPGTNTARGGRGGGAGEAGEQGKRPGGHVLDGNGGLGGNPGAAIDGVSYARVTDGPGDIRGAEIN